MRGTVDWDPSTDALRRRTDRLPTGTWPGLGLVLLVGAAALLLAAGWASAHPGQGGGFDGPVLEVENYDTPDDACDPDYDSEHTKTKYSDEASSGAFAFAPHSGCGFDFEAVEFDDEATFETVRARDANCGPAWGQPYSITVRVLLADVGPYGADETVASTTIAFDCTDPSFETYDFDAAATVPEGTHDLRVEYEVTGSAPLWINVRLDRTTVAFDGSPEAQVSEEAGVATDPAPEEDVTSPGVTAPASCEAGPGLEAVCDEPTGVTTPEVDETCDPSGLACAGPVPSADLVEADPLCETAPEACTDEQTVAEEQTLVGAGTVPAVESPEVGVDVVVEDTDVAVVGTPEDGETVDEVSVEAPFPPADGGIPVTACPGGCFVPTPVDVEAKTGAAVGVTVDGEEVAGASASHGTTLP